MKIQAWVAAATVVVASAASASNDVGALGASPKTFDGNFGGVTALPGETFFQQITFSLAEPGQTVLGTLGNAFGEFALGPVTLDSKASFAVLSAGNAVSAFSASVTPVKTSAGYTFSFDAVPAGNFVLTLSGTYATGVTGYQGTLAATPTVPEPSTLALSALGALALSGVVRRRLG